MLIFTKAWDLYRRNSSNLHHSKCTMSKSPSCYCGLLHFYPRNGWVLKLDQPESYIELQLNKAEYQLKPKNTCTQHKYVLIQYSMYVDIYVYIYAYICLCYIVRRVPFRASQMQESFYHLRVFKLQPIKFHTKTMRTPVFSILNYYFYFSQLTMQGQQKEQLFNFNSTHPATSIRWPRLYHQIVCPLPALQLCTMGITVSFPDIISQINWSLPFYSVDRENATTYKISNRQYRSDKNASLYFRVLANHIGINHIMILSFHPQQAHFYS